MDPGKIDVFLVVLKQTKFRFQLPRREEGRNGDDGGSGSKRRVNGPFNQVKNTNE